MKGLIFSQNVWDGSSVSTTTLNGSVGIGTSSPSEELEVYTNTQTTNNWPLIIRNRKNVNAQNYDVGIKLKFSTDSGNESNKWAGIKAVPEANAANSIGLAFYTQNTPSNAPGEAMRIDKNGKVGIGTSSPSVSFH